MKKFLVLCAVLLSVGACSTTKKSEMNNTKATATDSSKDAKDSMDKAKNSSSTAADMTASKASCILDKDTRVIEVKKTEAGGCELFYTKFGEAKSVASSGFGTQYCTEVKDRIQANLNKAGFSCQ